jgi:hypothetical protein
MVDWTGNYTINHVRYNGREVHLQGLFRGFGISREGAAAAGPYYYFLGDPHDSGTYLASANNFYTQLLTSLATRWSNTGSPPTGEVNAPGGTTANYRGTTMWDGS